MPFGKLYPFARFVIYSACEPVLSLAVKYANPVFGDTKTVIPPRWINYAGGGDFEKMGRENVRLLSEYAGLESNSRVLEIGCGICRNAAYLPEKLQSGSYEGFDIVRTGIYWGQNRITRFHPNFRFTRVDIRNGFYNPLGRINASDFEFPYGVDQFDVAFAYSVFTHILDEDAENYIEESARVLSNGGRLLFTAFVLTAAAREDIAAGRARYDFGHTVGRAFVEDANDPLLAVAYEEDHLRAMFSSAGFGDVQIIPGKWSGSSDSGQFQDIVIGGR